MRATLLAAALAVSALPASEARADDGLSLPMAETDAQDMLSNQCSQTQSWVVDATRFPIATRWESHTWCAGFQLDADTVLDNTVFTFADGDLVMLEARGNAAALRPDRDPDASVDGYDIFMAEGVTHRPGEDQAWLMSESAFRAFLMFWDNPVWRQEDPAPQSVEFHIPAQIVFGADIEAVHASLEGACQLLISRPIDQVWLRTAPQAQHQIDCFGYEMAGYPRKLEFVFGDGQLEQMWLMFGPADIPRLRTELTARYGETIHLDDQYEAFDGWRIALRKDIPEILMTSEAIAAHWRADGP